MKPCWVKALQVFSDPPYNVPIEGHVSGSGSPSEAPANSRWAPANGRRLNLFTAFLTSAFRNLAESSDDGSINSAALIGRISARCWLRVGGLR